MESTVANTRSPSQWFGPCGTALSNTSGFSCFRSRLVVLASFINPVHTSDCLLVTLAMHGLAMPKQLFFVLL